MDELDVDMTRGVVVDELNIDMMWKKKRHELLRL